MDISKFSAYSGLCSLTFGAIAITAVPTYAVEKISFVYDSLILSVSVDSLETFANEGIATGNLAFYLDVAGITAEQKALFREALSKPVPVDPVLISRSLHTDEGLRLLDYFGDVINIQGGRNGQYVIRGSLVQSAFEPEGLSLINVLRNFSTNIQLDVKKALVLGEKIDIIVRATYLFSEETARLSALEAENDPPVDFSQKLDIQQPGPFQVLEPQRFYLTDENRGTRFGERRFYVDVYRPKTWREGKTPVVIISHGLSSEPEAFAKQAKHLASYGYFVAVPQHPGSDIQQKNYFLEGLSRQIFLVEEFVDRPLDISQTLDELEKRNNIQYQGILDLENVGVFGHSFGGYTVLALSGATLDFEHLEEDCNINLGNMNTALLLQCRALNIEQKDYNFRDERIQAVYALNPVNASIFGPKGLAKIKIPTFIAAGNYDPATPFVFEQVRSFPWLTTANSYLLLQEGQAHVDFSQVDGGLSDLIDTVDDLTLPSPELLDDYTNSTMLAFFELHLTKNQDYAPYLRANYVQYLGKDEEFKAHLISQDSSEALKEIIEQFRLNNNIFR
ncbi:alpha/beta hydrolase [Crocosphaera sp.]|uniref:alpha/beta hydrolase n=1 Tax=Crocosphaera sp. TaxID=2729996 RepID=UPI0026230016|nr:alpha/beta hydrolase [Crocosphaera sp.]MDJ0579685.1 alpha/beta hydrolase [Crocosphaera sp.]